MRVLAPNERGFCEYDQICGPDDRCYAHAVKHRPIFAIDPGPTESAWVIYDLARVVSFGKYPNANLLQLLKSAPECHLVVEMIASMGMPVGAEVFDTCVWIGKFLQAYGGPHSLVKRHQVKLHMCNSPRANDGTIRQAVIDRFGGKDKAIGRKSSPGALYGVSGDVWQALALAITWSEMGKVAA